MPLVHVSDTAPYNAHDWKVGNRLGRWSQSRVDPDSSSISPAPRFVDFDSPSTYLRLTHQQLDKSTSTYFRLIINVFISRRRLILHSDECSTTKVPGYALDVDLFRLIRLINRSQVDLSTLDDRQMPTQGKEGFPTVQSWGRYQYMILVVISIHL